MLTTLLEWPSPVKRFVTVLGWLVKSTTCTVVSIVIVYVSITVPPDMRWGSAFPTLFHSILAFLVIVLRIVTWLERLRAWPLLYGCLVRLLCVVDRRA